MAGSKSQKRRQEKKARDKHERESKAENGGKTEIQPETTKHISPEILQENGVHAETCCRNQFLSDKSEGNGSSFQIAGVATEATTILPGGISAENRCAQEMKTSHGVMEETGADVDVSLKDGWGFEGAQENRSFGGIFREPVGAPQESLALADNLTWYETKDTQGTAVNSLENGMEVVTGFSPQGDTTHYPAVPIPHGTTRKSKAGSGDAPDQIEGALTKQELLSANTAEIKAIHRKLIACKDVDVAMKKEILSLSENVANTSAENYETEKQIAAAAAEVVKLRNEKAALESVIAENTQRVDSEKAALKTLEDETKQREKEAEECQLTLSALVTEKGHLADKLKASLSLQIELQTSLETETKAHVEEESEIELLESDLADEVEIIAELAKVLDQTYGEVSVFYFLLSFLLNFVHFFLFCIRKCSNVRLEIGWMEETISKMNSELEAAMATRRSAGERSSRVRQESLRVEKEHLAAKAELERRRAAVECQWTSLGSLATITGAVALSLTAVLRWG